MDNMDKDTMAPKRKGPSQPPTRKKRATTSATKSVTAVSSPNLPTTAADTCPNSSSASESVPASEDDFSRVTNELGPDNLQHLFRNLGIQQHHIEHAEQSANTTDTRLKAFAVLRWWKKTKGRDATREALLDAQKKICSSSSAARPIIDNVPFNVEVCKQELITFYKHEIGKVQLLPWCDEARDMDDIYVTLELEERTTKGISLLAKNEDLVSLQTTRVLVKGVAGSGKSTLLAKLAYGWSQKEKDSLLSKFDLVFMLSLREVQQGCSLIDAIFQQILADDTVVQGQGLQMYINSHPNQVLILLDGFDEYKSKSNLQDMNDSTKDDTIYIAKIITYDVFRNCHVILSTRPHEQVTKHQSHYTSVKLLGFSSKNVLLYIERFFDNNKGMVVTLSNRLGESDVLKSLATIPVMLMLMCLLWEDEHKLPDTQSELYDEFAMYLYRKYCVRKKKNIDFSKDCKSEEEFNKIIWKLGQVALDGLCPEGNAKQEQIMFSQQDFEKHEHLYDIGCKIGLLTKERLRSKLNASKEVTFLHKSFQEFCAAKYWAKLFHTKPDHFIKTNTLLQIEALDVLLTKLELMKFICGLVDKSGAVIIMQHAIDLFRKEKDHNDSVSVGLSVDKDWGILPILILLHESGITLGNYPSLAQSFQMLFAKERLNVYDSPPQSLLMFHYLIKSVFSVHVMSLGVIRSLTFEHIPLVMSDVLIDTLQYTTSVRNIHIVLNLKDDGHSETSLSSLDKLGKALAGLPEVYQIHLIGSGYMRFVNMNILLHHLSTSVNRNKYTDLNLAGAAFKIADIGQLVSNLDNLKSLSLQSSTGCNQDVAAMLQAIHSNIEHIELDNVDFGDAIENMIPLVTSELQTLALRSNSLEEEHVRKLSENISKAPNLEVLTLSYNTVGTAMEPLAQQLQHCRKLSKLDLSTTSITDAGIEKLAQTFSSIPDLVYLDISGNNLGNASFDAIFRNIHNLSKLESLEMGGGVDQQCSALVKDCLGLMGKVPGPGSFVLQVDKQSQFQLIHATASKYL